MRSVSLSPATVKQRYYMSNKQSSTKQHHRTGRRAFYLNLKDRQRRKHLTEQKRTPKTNNT